MGMSATRLGEHFGHKTGAAMNVLLSQHGLLEGSPGRWAMTELGLRHGGWSDHDNGYGGFAHRQWSFPLWDDSVIDVLRASTEAHPDGLPIPDPEPVAVAVESSTQAAAQAASGTARQVRDLSPEQKVAIGALVVIGVVAAAPRVKRAWDEKARPAARRLRSRLNRRGTEPQSGSETPTAAS